MSATRRIPAFRSDVLDCGQRDGRFLIADPLTASYFALGPLEDVVRRALTESLDLTQLQARCARLGEAGVVALPEIEAIVGTFERHRVLEPTLDQLSGPRQLALVLHEAHALLHARRLLPKQADVDTVPAAEILWQTCATEQRRGVPVVETLTHFLHAAKPATGMPSNTPQRAVRIAWMRNVQRAKLAPWQRVLHFLSWRVPLVTGGLPWLRYLRPFTEPACLIGLVALWFVTLVLVIATPLAASLSSPARLMADTPAWLLIAMLPLVVAPHEVAHAAVCARFGGRVRELGLIFLIGLPLPYVDVTDSWTLPRRQRLWISLAGCCSDLTLLSLALLLVPCTASDSAAHAALLAMVALACGSLLLNLNPLFRFDGYYVLADLLAVRNPRAQLLGRLFSPWWRGRATHAAPGASTPGLWAYAACALGILLLQLLLLRV